MAYDDETQLRAAIDEYRLTHGPSHGTSHAVTGEYLPENSIVTADGERIYWCGHTEPAQP